MVPQFLQFNLKFLGKKFLIFDNNIVSINKILNIRRRYTSLIFISDTLPTELEVTGRVCAQTNVAQAFACLPRCIMCRPRPLSWHVRCCPRLTCMASTTETVHNTYHCSYFHFSTRDVTWATAEPKVCLQHLLSPVWAGRLAKKLRSHSRANVLADLNDLLSRVQQLRYLTHLTRVTTVTLLLQTTMINISDTWYIAFPVTFSVVWRQLS